MYQWCPVRRKHLLLAIFGSLFLHAIFTFSGWLLPWGKSTESFGSNFTENNPNVLEVDVYQVQNTVQVEPKTQIKPVHHQEIVKIPSQMVPLNQLPGVEIPNIPNEVEPAPKENPSPGAPTDAPAVHPKLKNGKTVVYILDSSSSMALNRAYPRAIASMRTSLNQLGGESRFQVVTYGKTATRWGNSLISPNHLQIHNLCLELAQKEPEGSSNHLAGVQAGFIFRPDLLVLLTDGDDFSLNEVIQIRKLVGKTFILIVFCQSERTISPTSPLHHLIEGGLGKIQHLGD
ncbi:MAG: vWA domain-containing protein [Zavarzinella sp.]